MKAVWHGGEHRIARTVAVPLFGAGTLLVAHFVVLHLRAMWPRPGRSQHRHPTEQPYIYAPGPSPTAHSCAPTNPPPRAVEVTLKIVSASDAFAPTYMPCARAHTQAAAGGAIEAPYASECRAAAWAAHVRAQRCAWPVLGPVREARLECWCWCERVLAPRRSSPRRRSTRRPPRSCAHCRPPAQVQARAFCDRSSAAIGSAAHGTNTLNEHTHTQSHTHTHARTPPRQPCAMEPISGFHF